MTKLAFMLAQNGTWSWIATVPRLNTAVPRYSGVWLMLMSRLGATILHGVSWSSKANCPRHALKYRSVVVKRWGPFGSSSLVNLGTLCRSSHFSTSICQSVISTDEMVISFEKTVDQSSETDRRLAVKNGRSVGFNPSIEKSSTTTRPRRR